MSEEYKAPGQIPITNPDDPNRQPLEETRTLWYDRQLGQILAYNLEGRVFVELLGDQNPDGRTRKHLGIEIVDVVKQPDAAPVSVDLGELLTAYQNDTPDDADLFPSRSAFRDKPSLSNTTSMAQTDWSMMPLAKPAISTTCRSTGWRKGCKG